MAEGGPPGSMYPVPREQRKGSKKSAKTKAGRQDLSLQGIGGEVWSSTGESLGCVVAEVRQGWKLADGRVCKINGEGVKWFWTSPSHAGSEASRTTDDLASQDLGTPLSQLVPDSPAVSEATSVSIDGRLMLPAPKIPLHGAAVTEVDSAPQTDGKRSAGARSVGAEIVGLNGESWGVVIAEDRHRWFLADGRIARRSNEGHRWRWASDALASPLLVCQERVECSEEDGMISLALPLIGSWLPLSALFRAAASCSSWATVFMENAPLKLSPKQVDAVLQFSLLEVLVSFDDARLPLPMSAVYSEMRSVIKRLASTSTGRSCLEESVRAQADCDKEPSSDCPHHIDWMPEIKGCSFKSLEHFARHYDGLRLIEVFKQRWRKQIHHSPNTRTCIELLLTNVNRQQPLFQEHLARQAGRLHTR